MIDRISDMLAQVCALWRDLTGHELFYWGNGAPSSMLVSTLESTPEGLPAGLLDLAPESADHVESITLQNQIWLAGRIGQPPVHISIASRQTDPTTLSQFKVVIHLLNGLMEDSRRAYQIQASFLPTNLPEIPEFEFGASLLPAHLIGGDYYDIQGVQDRWAIMVGDVAGKGIPAAMLAAMIHATLKSEINHHTKPAELLQRINQLMYAELDRSHTFITTFLAMLQTRPLKLHYASAGHTTTLLWRSAEQQVLQLPSTGLPLGIYPHTTYTEHVVPFHPDDILMLYSDGITEAENAQGRVFGGQALIDLLLAGHPAPIDKQIQLIFSALDLHRGQLPLRDDVILLMVRARGPEIATQVQPFVFTAEKHNVRTLATQVRQVASGLSFSSPAERSAFLNDLELAVSEIATNIVIHAYKDSPYQGRIQGRVSLFPENVQVDLIDSGAAYHSPSGLSPHSSRRDFSPIDPPTSGYGLAIARRLLDTCAYTRLPEGRNHWQLEKSIPHPAGISHPEPGASSDRLRE